MVMFLGCILGGLGSLVYWYVTACVSGECDAGSNFFSVIIYGVFIGLFVADLISQGIGKNEA